MKDYWNGLTARERGLLISLGCLILIVTLWLGVVRPLEAARASAAREHVAARELYETVAGAAAEARALHAAGRDARAKASDQPLRVVIAVSARGAGVSISRIQPGEDGTLTLWADDVGSAPFYRWLTSLAEDQQITPVKVSLQKAGNGPRLRAQVQFEEAR
ncbi:type II secretion system protein M [Kordiimonas aestuarii]|uniref:type II secretion system protein M n=1 Tax=Kordiimonas aestuarii TaxID=1005925 RepID=UPI0021D1B696|nr:type II secretion system protein M [Kordiimonas aestuarii]